MKRSPLKRKTRIQSKGSIVRVCAADGCENGFTTFPSHDKRFCSRRCAYDNREPQSIETRQVTRERMLAQDRTGSRNPNFRHGRRTGDHMRGWNPAAKGETCCRLCGDPKWLNLHHVVPRGICPPPAKRDLRNGIVLCASCHQKWHKGALLITRDIFTADEWAYISSLELTGREVAGWLDKHYPEPTVMAA